MNCCQCQGIEELFNEKTVSRELARYRQQGPNRTTQWLVDALQQAGHPGRTLLDIGGGVGAIQHALLAAGVQQAVDVDASAAYLHAARQEAERRGLAGRVQYRHGNFVDLASQIPPADIVTLDRVICCYDDLESLVTLSAAKAQKFYALVYPRDTWWIRLGLRILNSIFRLQKNPYRAFAHPTRSVEALVKQQGLTRRAYSRTLFWQAAVYTR